MTFLEFHNQVVYELVFNNGVVVRGTITELGKYLKDFDCGSIMRVADDFWQPVAVKDIVKGWKTCGCDCTIDEYFEENFGNDVGDQIQT